MQDLTTISSSSSLTNSNSLSTNNLLSPLFTALGWKDLKPAIVAAEQADQVLAIELQQAYDAYTKTPDEASKHRLQMVLDQAIGELQADLTRVEKLEKEAAKRLAKPQTNSSSFLASWGSWIKQGAQSFLGSDDASLVERYAGIAQQRQESITALSHFREGLATQITSQKMETSKPEQESEIIDVISPASRRLLEAANPTESIAQYCYPAGRCNLSDLHDGQSGFLLQGEAIGDWNGFSVSNAGDINGDGLDDILIGAPYADSNGRNDTGKTYIVFGSNQTDIWEAGLFNLTSLMDGQRGFMLKGEGASDYNGAFVRSAGDINGDGLADVIVGAYLADPPGAPNAGKSYVIFGSNQTSAWGSGVFNISSLMDGQRGFVLQGAVAGDGSGISVSGGDINGDKLSDVVVGAPGANPNGYVGAGKTYVVFGSNQTSAWGSGILNLTNLSNGQRGFTLQGEEVGDQSGYSVSSIGDMNGDSFADILVGAPGARNFTGKSYVVFGSNQANAWGSGVLNLTSLMNGQQGFMLQGEWAGDYSGYAVGGMGDINGDLFMDLAIGAVVADPDGRINAGKTYVVFGTNQTNAWSTGRLNLTSLMNGLRGFILQGETAGDESGLPVRSAGDVNADGFADILVGAAWADPNGVTTAGNSYIVFGSNETDAWGSGILNLTSLVNAQRGFVLQGEGRYDYSGRSVSSAGDINGDGFIDILVGTPQIYPTNSTNTGESYVIFGDSGCQFQANQLTVYQGVPAVLSSENLNATYAKPVRFNITTITHGQFEYINNPGQAITLFNQTEVWNGQVRFVPDASAVAPSYNLQIPGASKIVTYLPPSATINFYPFFNANQLTIHQGESLVMTDTFMNATSSYPYSPAEINMTISNLQHGQFFLMPLNNSVLQFSQEVLLAGEVLFIHDNSPIAPSYDVTVSNPVATLSPSAAQVTFYHRPVWLVNQLTLSQGDSVLLSNKQINVIEDASANEMVFTVSDLQHGEFRLTPANNTITAFTEQQLLNGKVLFVHDKTDNAPSYALVLDDGYFVLPPEPAVVNFTPLPPVLNNNRLSTKQGRNTTLTSTDLSATDPDPTYDLSTLVFTISDIQHGKFTLQDNATNVTQFAQGQITSGQIIFTQDDSTTAPSYKVVVSNAKNSTTPQAATISFDARPILLNNRLSIESGESVVLAITDLQAIDDITFSGSLLFKANNIQHGYFSQLQAPNVSIIEFYQQRIRDAEIQFQHDGSLSSPTYTIVAADESGLESFPQDAQINFKSTPKSTGGLDLEKLYTTISSIGGVALAIGGYIWWRKLIASHRRGFELANNLRKAANLEYHDFMRFDGDIYKSKIDNLLIKLDLFRPGFYRELTNPQRKSFAVCIAEILGQRGLLEPSGCGMGMYGWMLAFSVGWSQQLKLKDFENQLTEIAQQAVTIWEAQENPTAYWPYFSPTCKDKAKAFCCPRPSRAGMFARDRMPLRGSIELKEPLIPVSSSEQGREEVMLPIRSPSSSSTFFPESKMAQGANEDRLRAIIQQEISESIKPLKERLEQLETGTRPLLTSSSSSSS